jgi:hypothetical protein
MTTGEGSEMQEQAEAGRQKVISSFRYARPAILTLLCLGAGALGVTAASLGAPAQSAPAVAKPLPPPPANGEMGFVVQDFVPPVVPGMDACPTGTAPRLREAYLRTLPEPEQTRLKLKENEAELTRLWQSYAFGPNGTNVCSQPQIFNHAPYPGVQSKYGLGLDLDSGRQSADSCAHDAFQSPAGEQGIDNQEYRAMGCTLEMRGADGQGGDALTGMKQFHSSGEWTQVILLKGVNSLVDDPDVEVIYANTADRPSVDSKGAFLRNVSFTVNDTGTRHRNVLHGRIMNGVLTTDPAEIRLAQTWGQGGARDIRGNRSQYHYQKGRLRLEFQPDGTLRGFVGGYRSIFDVIISPSLGGAGSALVAGIDCAAQYAALAKYADGMRDPRTGKCTAVSSAMRIGAVPAFVTDLPPTRTASR